jgi:hypothetical protein
MTVIGMIRQLMCDALAGQAGCFTPHNHPLSGATEGRSEATLSRAIECTNSSTRWPVYVRQSLAPATLRAYRADLDHFEKWGGSIPSSEAQVASYLAAHAETLAVATLVRRLASISQAHAVLGVTSPTGTALVRATMRGIRRVRGSAHRRNDRLSRCSATICSSCSTGG